MGNAGRHIEQAYNLNEVPYGARFLPQNQDPTNPGTPLNDNYFRPYQGWGDITVNAYRGNSSYHSLQAQARRRLAHGLSFGFAYTWSKAMDDGINVTTYLPNRPWNYEESSYDRTHILAANYSWESPRISRLRVTAIRELFGGWQISGITRFQSGAPLNMPYLGPANLISGADLTGGGDGWRPLMVANPVLPKSRRTFDEYFNPNAFVAPAGGYPYGNAPATFARGPGIDNWNLAIARIFRFKLGEKGMACTIRGEAYNALNHTQFSGVNVTPKFDQTGAQVNQAFGQITSARDPRIMQFMLRLAF
ncbi:TonB-dependent receptor (fragment) [Candidatus Sulfopaludibacter sp. SbA3]